MLGCVARSAPAPPHAETVPVPLMLFACTMMLPPEPPPSCASEVEPQEPAPPSASMLPARVTTRASTRSRPPPRQPCSPQPLPNASLHVCGRAAGLAIMPSGVVV